MCTQQLKIQTEHEMQLILLAGLSLRNSDKAEHSGMCQQKAPAETGEEIHLFRTQPWMTTQTLPEPGPLN